MKNRIYIFVSLVLLLAALPELAMAAGPSDLASAGCADQSQAIAYPSADIAGNSAACSVGYAIPYPAADFEGDGISSFVRSVTTDPSADIDERYVGEWRGTILTAQIGVKAAPEVAVNSAPMELRRTYGHDRLATTDPSADINERYVGEWRGTILTARIGDEAVPEVTANSGPIWMARTYLYE